MKRIFGMLLILGLVIVAAANLEAVPDSAEAWPHPFQNTFLSVKLWQWFLLGALFLICFGFGVVARYVAAKLTHLRDRVVPQPMSASTRLAVSKSAGLLVGSLTALILLPSLRLQETIRYSDGVLEPAFGQRVELVVDALFVVSLTMLAYAYWDATCDTIAAKAAGHRRAERLLVPMMRKFIRALIVTLGVLIVLAVTFGAKTLTGLVAGLGVTGLVVALAGKDSVENVFGSLTILFDMPFALGDYVRIDKVEGNVEEINLRSTRIRTVEDTLITLPNANLIRASVENFGARRSRRQKLTLRLSYGSDPQSIEAFSGSLRDFLKNQPQVEGERTLVQLDDPSETSLGLVIIWYVKADSVFEEAQSRTKLLDEALRLKNIHGLNLAALPALPNPNPQPVVK